MNGIIQHPQEIFKTGPNNFEARALEIFRYQAQQNFVYSKYLRLLGVDAAGVSKLAQIPFLPIELFKQHQIIPNDKSAALVFESSGTTGTTSSKHYVAEPTLYEKSFTATFTSFFGTPMDMCILALLPSYLERGNSSLVYMVDHLIKMSGHPDSGFFLHNMDDLARVLQQQAANGQPTMLIGVTYALLDLAEQYPMPLGNTMILETGGMKGRRKELTRTELHEILKEAFQVPKIFSEYGMTELLSQAYTDGTELFTPPDWMKVYTRDPYDPLSLLTTGSTGGINVIDLANIYSCPFIATGDLGKVLPDGRFSVLGRLDSSDIRGCNLMLE